MRPGIFIYQSRCCYNKWQWGIQLLPGPTPSSPGGNCISITFRPHHLSLSFSFPYISLADKWGRHNGWNKSGFFSSATLLALSVTWSEFWTSFEAWKLVLIRISCLKGASQKKMQWQFRFASKLWIPHLQTSYFHRQCVLSFQEKFCLPSELRNVTDMADIFV